MSETRAYERSRPSAKHAREERASANAILLAAVSAALTLTGCAARQAPPPMPQARWTGTEMFNPRSPRAPAMADLALPRSSSPRRTRYEIVDGTAVLEGDIVLGDAPTVAARFGSPLAGATQVFGATVLADRSRLWSRGEIPFEIEPDVDQATVDEVHRGIALLDGTALHVRPRTPLDKDYVVFTVHGQGCNSYMGRTGGAQRIVVEMCGGGSGSVAHEILHAAGFYHEQSRGDRDAFIVINWDDIEPDFRFAFERRDAKDLDVGAYDYGSVMHYGATAFSRTGNPTIIPKAPGVRIGQREALSTGDRAAIATLYAGAPIAPSIAIPNLPLPIPMPQQLPQIPGLPSIFAPIEPPSAPSSACASGSVRDVVTGACASPCTNGAPPIAGVCAPANAPAIPSFPGF